MKRVAQVSILCAMLVAGSSIAGASTPDECHTLTMHGHGAEAHTCYESH